jgi:hypothetical protein
MKYFYMHFDDAVRAQQKVWDLCDEAGGKRVMFHTSAIGMDTSVWTDEPSGEALFRQVLIKNISG